MKTTPAKTRRLIGSPCYYIASCGMLAKGKIIALNHVASYLVCTFVESKFTRSGRGSIVEAVWEPILSKEAAISKCIDLGQYWLNEASRLRQCKEEL